METEVFVYVDIAGEPHRVGRLWAHVSKGKENGEYIPHWLVQVYETTTPSIPLLFRYPTIGMPDRLARRMTIARSCSDTPPSECLID